MIDKAWVALGVAAIVLPAIVYSGYLQRYVYRKMFSGEEILDNLNDLADEAKARDAAKQIPESSAR
ncbi:MAG TPA: hypothetical protein VNV38_11375 [Stellaceae bacterium]|jgi:hypothetical protein|nr:hypothetical protein [Stellaceae bacterium]